MAMVATTLPQLLQVAHGLRMPLDRKLPEPVLTLIDECWSGLPDLRPSTSEVARQLREMEEGGVLDAMAADSGGAAGGGCCTVM